MFHIFDWLWLLLFHHEELWFQQCRVTLLVNNIFTLFVIYNFNYIYQQKFIFFLFLLLKHYDKYTHIYIYVKRERQFLCVYFCVNICICWLNHMHICSIESWVPVSEYMQLLYLFIYTKEKKKEFFNTQSLGKINHSFAFSSMTSIIQISYLFLLLFFNIYFCSLF